MKNVKVIKESEKGRCWNNFRLVYYRGFYRIQKQQDDGNWEFVKGCKLREEREARTELNVWIACNTKPEYRTC